jgi:hypothetical protein
MKSHSEKPADRNDGEGKMSKRPLAASRPWTPAEEENLRALAASGARPTTIFVLHKANLSSGGTATEIELGDFLGKGKAGPEHQALARLIGTLVDRD